MGLLRTIFWFEKGELSEIRGKLTALKWGYETRLEADVLGSLRAARRNDLPPSGTRSRDLSFDEPRFARPLMER